MFRYSLTTLIGVSLGMTGFAQTNPPKELPGLFNNNPGKVVSNAIPLPVEAKETPAPTATKESNQKLVHTSAKIPETMVGHTSSCADTKPCTDAKACDTKCETCPTSHKTHRSCFGCFQDWFAFHSSPTPCECRSTPTPYHPPLIAYFQCKGKIPFTYNVGAGCADKTCSTAPGIVDPHAVPAVPTTPVAPTTNPLPQAPVPPMTPTISSSYKGGPTQPTAPVNPGMTTTSMKPLSLYAPGGVKTSSMQKSEASPPLTGQSSTLIPGYKRLGGPKTEPVSSNPLYPWK